MGFLRRLTDLEPARLFRKRSLPVGFCDVGAHRVERFFGRPRRIGTHVGDETHRAGVTELAPFVQPLRQPHRLGDWEAELARGVLLEFRGDERRRRVLLLFLRLEFGDLERHRIGPGRFDLENHGGLVFAGRLGGDHFPSQLGQGPSHLFARDDFDLLPALGDQLRAELRRFARPKLRGQRPVFSRDERFDRAFALDDDP